MSVRPGSDAPGGGRLAEPTRPVPAATVVVLRPGPDGLEVLLTRRASTMAFGPDIHVFPGGRVDAGDADPDTLERAGLSPAAAARNLGLGLELGPGGRMAPATALAHHVAAVRETAEETGIAICAADLISLSRWVTPISLARRFDVRFFATLVPPGTEVLGDSAEVTDAFWLTPTAALEAAARGDLAVWQPTFVTLQQLDGLGDEAAIRAAFALGPGGDGPSLHEVRDDLVRVEATWAGGIAGRRAKGWLAGRREVVAVNPADPTGETMDAFRATIEGRGGRLVGVVIADLAPDRHAGVEMLAHGLGLPVVAPTGVVPWAPYPVIELDLGDVLPFGEPAWTLGDVIALG